MTAAQIVELIRVERSVDLSLAGSFAGGEVGAADVRGGDGARYVLKWWPGEDELESVRRAVSLVERLRARGYPAPRYSLVDVVGGTTVAVQEFVDGAASDVVSDDLVDALVGLNGLQEGVAEGGESWAEYLRGSLTRGCRGYCVHESLRGYDARTASLLAKIRGIGERTRCERLRQADAVHLDFHHRNVLVRDGTVAAVVDWEGCRPGDRAFDLVTLAFGLTVATVSERARATVWEAVRGSTDADVRLAYVAHMALRQVDWSIRHRTAADVAHWLRVADEFFERCEADA